MASMNDIAVSGGTSTSKSRTSTFYATSKINLSAIKIPINLSTSTSSTKSATVTVTVGSTTNTAKGSWSTSETGTREVEVSVGREFSGTFTVKFSGTNATVNYGDYTYPLTVGGGLIITEYAYQMTLTYSADPVWQTSDDNDGYPYIIGYPPDLTEFSGYNDPKPPNSWKIDNNNDGYPWTWGFDTIPTGGNVYIKTADGLVPVTIYLKETGGLIPLQFLKVKED